MNKKTENKTIIKYIFQRSDEMDTAKLASCFRPATENKPTVWNSPVSKTRIPFLPQSTLMNHNDTKADGL